MSERKLAAAVLLQAVHDYQSRNDTYRRDAAAWIASNNAAHVFSFVSICQLLDLNPATVRNRLSETHKTFEEYCKERWGMSRFYAHRLIESADVTENLLPIGDISQKPQTESQARPLTSLEPEEQREARPTALFSPGSAFNKKPRGITLYYTIKRLTAKNKALPGHFFLALLLGGGLY